MARTRNGTRVPIGAEARSFPETGTGSGSEKSFTKLSHSRDWSPKLERRARDERVRDPQTTAFLKAENILVALTLTPTLSRRERETHTRHDLFGDGEGAGSAFSSCASPSAASFR